MRTVSTRWVMAGVVVVTLLLAGVVSFYASGSPDGLERVSEDKGFSHTATDHDAADGPLADYAVRDVDNERLAGGLAGVIGVGVVLALGAGLAYVVRRKPAREPDESEQTPVA